MNEEIFFRSIYEHIEIPIFVVHVDVAGDFVFGGLNPACEKATGLRNEDVIGKRPEEISGLPKEGASALRANCQRCLEANDIIRCGELFVGRGQGTRWLTQLAPVRDEAGKIVQIIGSSVNITDLIRAEEALRESELRYREVFENISDCIFILDVTPDGRFKFVEFNPAEEKSVGYSTSEVFGKFIEETVPAELAKQVTANYRRCLEAGTLISYDEELPLPVGRRSFHTVLIPVRNAAGNIYRIVGVARDITKHTLAERELQQSRDLLTAIIEAAPTAIIGLDLDGNVRTVWNPAAEKMLGWSAQEVMGRPLPSVPVESQEEFSRFRERIRRGEILDGVEVHRQRRDGTPIDCSIYASPLHDAEGRIIGNIAVLVDITKRKQAEEELRASEEHFSKAFHLGPIGIVIFRAADERFVDVNDAFLKSSGYTREEIIGHTEAELQLYAIPEEHESNLRALKERGSSGPFEFKSRKKSGEIGAGLSATTEITLGGEKHYLSMILDITEHKRIDNIMQARLRLLEFANSHSVDELLTATLDEMEALTGSSIGFYHFLEADQETLSLQNWSTNTLKNMYTAAGKGSHYNITQAGVWADCVYERRPVIHNDYASLSHRKGMPEGHAPVVRVVVVPIFRGNLIKAIVGVGNKPTNYDESDVKIVSQLGDLSWDIVERKLAEDSLRHSEEEKTILNQIANIFLTIPDEAMYGEVLPVVLQVMKSKFGYFGYIGENGDLIIPSFTGDIWSECQVPGKSIVFPSDSWGDSLWGRAIREKKAFCSDGPFRTPEGHIRIDHFLTVPIVFGQETIGLISVANKEGGYAEEDKDFLEHITRSVSPILHARLQRDIQERRRMAAEGNLRESEEKYRHLVTNADEAIFIVQDEVVKFPNPKALEMSGYSAEELAGISFTDLIRPGDKDKVFEDYSRLLEGERPPEIYPFRIIDKKGKEMWVQLTIAPIIWEKKPGILCFLRDVTEEKKLEAQLMQAQKLEALGRLAGGVAHDFNNMLVVIIGHAELALENVAPSDPLHAQLQEIDKAARRSADLTRQLLAFARKQTIAPRVLNLNDTVSGMLKMLRRIIGEDIGLAWMPGADLWPVKMDPGQIDQVLANLCVNARDAIAGVGKVTIETGNIAFDEAYCADHAGFVPGEYVLLAVSDNGSGMDKETLVHLFEPFFTTKGMGQGTGLGLATVYGIVKQNGGFINVYSEPGQGTTFKTCFPRHKAEPAEALVESAAKTPLGGMETVLMVEDEMAILNLGKRILEELGYAVLIAKTPGEAIRLVEEHTGEIHLLITDVVMPEMNGRDLAELLASIKPGLKCLYMSGYTANIIANRGVLEEGVHFIQKPFSMKDLAVRVREALDQNSTNRE